MHGEVRCFNHSMHRTSSSIEEWRNARSNHVTTTAIKKSLNECRDRFYNGMHENIVFSESILIFSERPAKSSLILTRLVVQVGRS